MEGSVICRRTCEGSGSDQTPARYMVEVYVLLSNFTFLDIVPYRYCIPMSEHHRPITVAEEVFFSKCGTGRGK